MYFNEISKFLPILIFSSILDLFLASSKYSDWARPKFEKQFEDKCSKYPFVEEFYNQFEKVYDKNSKYVIPVFSEPRVKQGGLGDKLAGIANAIGYALRTKRTILMQGDVGFEEAFRPKPKNNADIGFTWQNKSWASWKTEYMTGDNMIHITGCINPYRPKDEVHCKLENQDYIQKVVKIRSNRAYLCRWDEQRDSDAYNFLKNNTVDSKTNLFDIAGCFLRLVLWPTDKLWDRVDQIMEPIFSKYVNYSIIKETSKTSNITLKKNLFQIGIHFRCGDIEYKSPYSVGKSCIITNPNMRYSNISEFLVDGTPIDGGECGKKLIEERHINLSTGDDESVYPIVYIASDSPSAAIQINETLNFSNTLITPKGCHIELDKSGQCSFETIAYWFALSLSDTLILQGRTIQAGDNYTSPSGFSRLASMYGLNSDSIRFAQTCEKIKDINFHSRTTQGTWKCTERPHFEEGALVRLSDQKEIFVIRNKTRRAIPNWDTFLHEGFSSTKVQAISTAFEWAHIPLGPPLEPCSSC